MSEENKFNNQATAYKGRGGIIEHGRPWNRQPLRRPGEKASMDDSEAGGGPSENALRVSHSTSKLSPMAKEFIPSSRLSFTPSSSSTAVPSYTPSNVQQQQAPPPRVIQESQLAPQPHENGSCAENNIAIEHLRPIMYEITVNPGNFDMLATLLVDALNAMVQDDATLRAIASEIFEQAVSESNFRYNGARLCSHLAKNLTLSFPSEGFRMMLFQRCQREFSAHEWLAKEQGERLCGFTMFMGELFIHLEITREGGQRQKIGLLGQTVPKLLRILLETAVKEYLKCACQMLKFTGAALEDFERSSNNDACPVMDGLFHTMKELSVDDRLDRNCKELLIKVIELRASNWGRVQSTSYASEEPSGIDRQVSDPVFYGPDGLPLSKEEALFLESNAQYMYDNNSTEDDSSEVDFYGGGQSTWSMSDGMDDEIAAAYEKFVLENS